MINAAMIGTGGWADALAGAVRGSTALRIAGCYSRGPIARAAFAERHHCHAFHDMDGVLSYDGIDALILATPHSTHRPYIEAAAAAGKHVFCEKPVTLTVADGEAAAEACRRAGVVLAVGHNRRFTPAARRLKAMLDDGEFGVVSHLEAQFSFPGSLIYVPGHWRAEPSENPGGPIAACGIHVIDTSQWLLGPIIEVTAICTQRQERLTIPDTAIALVRFASGSTGYLGTLFAAPYTCWLNLYGTRKVALADLDADFLRLQHADAMNARPTESPIDPADSVRASLEAFAEACAGVRPYPIPVSDAIRNVAVMEAMVRSSAEGKTVTITAA